MANVTNLNVSLGSDLGKKIVTNVTSRVAENIMRSMVSDIVDGQAQGFANVIKAHVKGMPQEQQALFLQDLMQVASEAYGELIKSAVKLEEYSGQPTAH